MRLAARVTTGRWRGNTDAGRGGRGGRGGYQGGEADEEDDTRCRHSTPQHYTPHNTKTSNNLERDIRPGGSARTLRTLLAIYSARGFYFGQIDVETAYLYALVQELIYMRPPKGTNYGPNKICRLLKSLYGLKQAGRNWYLDLKDYLVELGFKPGEVDIGMYSAAVGTENEIWILVYVDDIIFASKNEQTKDIFAGHLRKKYRITEPTTDMGTRNESIVRARWHHPHSRSLQDAEARHLAQQFVGAILYAAVISRPDLSSTVRVMSHVMSKPPSNFEACKKHVLRYLSGTINRGIKYNTNSNVPLKLIGYCDASWGDNHENRRSTSGYIFFLNGGPISWASYPADNRSLINS
ncbi:hypothetical protein RI054_02g07520 [Pseudoscourfieldia marina]